MRRELLVFLVVGVLTVLIDFCAYRAMVWFGIDVDVSKGAGFLVGTIFAYFANRLWTFGRRAHGSGTAWRFALLYLSTLALNIAINALALKALASFSGAVQASFLMATAASAMTNFAGMKWFVFKSRALS